MDNKNANEETTNAEGKGSKTLTEEEVTVLFKKEYSELCEKYNRTIAVEPYFWQSNDTGAYAIRVKSFVRKLKGSGKSNG